jgi:ATP-dependent Clp protease protease subunit
VSDPFARPPVPAPPQTTRLSLTRPAGSTQPPDQQCQARSMSHPFDSFPFAAGEAGPTGPTADIYGQLLKERIIFLGTQIDAASANLVCAQLLLLAAEDAARDVHLYINSPGGSIDAGLAIYDTMQLVSCDVATTCMGVAASMGQFLLCAGTPGKRFALPHARILMHQPSGQMQGQAADIAIQAEQIIYLKRVLAERIAFHTGQPIERVEADSDRDRWFSAQEAKDYGFIDAVVQRTARVGEPALA